MTPPRCQQKRGGEGLCNQAGNAPRAMAGEESPEQSKGPPAGDPLPFRLSARGGRSPQVPRLLPPVYIRRVPAAVCVNDSAIADAVSAPRIGTYLREAGGDLDRAVALYGWNARISAALMLPAHFAEVVIRNAVDEALAGAYGSDWPWNPTFRTSLPNGGRPGYSPRRDLESVSSREVSTGKVIAELKFVFWPNMFTARHDVRIWDDRITGLFPGSTGSAHRTRRRIYEDLNEIRRLRNRIAHHEPIFVRNLSGDLDRMLELIELRSAPTGKWVREMEDATVILSEHP